MLRVRPVVTSDERRQPTWISKTNAVFLCLTCSGKHRGLGVAKSFVRSVTLDNISDEDLEYMARGGNRRMRELLQEFQMKPDLPLTMRYSFLALYWYRHLVSID